MLSDTNKKLILLALRNAAKILEEELEPATPVLPKRRSRKQQIIEGFERRYTLGIGGKPEHLKKGNQKKKTVATTTVR